MRYLGRTHRVSIAWLHEVFKGDNMILHKCDTTPQAADIFTKSFTDVSKWKHALSLIHFGVSVGDHVPSVVDPPQPSLPKQKKGGAPAACCCRAAHVSKDDDLLIQIGEKLLEDNYLREERGDSRAVRRTREGCVREIEKITRMAGNLFNHDDGYYLFVNHPEADPGKDGTVWRQIIGSDDCFLPRTTEANPLLTLVPTNAEWESISTAIRQDKLNMRMFCRKVQKNIRYKQDGQIHEAQVWVGDELPDGEKMPMLQNFANIYSGFDAEKERQALELYNKVIRFVKTMVIATTEVMIPPYIMHGWRKPAGVASDVWWEHQ
eukprot:5375869-Amphidinium_carterae.1